MKIKTLIFAFTIILLTSCKTTTNNITYFQDLNNQSAVTTGKAVNYTPRKAPDDQLSITVSGMDPNAVATFNIPLASYLAPGETNVTSTPVLHTYLVNSHGEIDFPVLGKLQVGGMTRSELTDMMTKRISAYVKSPIVTIHIRNFNLTSAEMLTSPNYYLQQNDVLYVEPNKARKGNAKYSQNGQFNVSLASTIISALSVLASLGIALLVK